MSESSASPATLSEGLRKLLADLEEPRLGIHEDGTEELKTWEALWQQCQDAAAALRELASARSETRRNDLELALLARAQFEGNAEGALHEMEFRVRKFLNAAPHVGAAPSMEEPQQGCLPGNPGASGQTAAGSSAPSATRPICPFCNQAALYANPNNTRAEGAPATLLQTRKKCPTCPYFNGCMVGDCDYGN